MHEGDKVGLSAIGKLTRSKNRVIVNPFVEGVAFLENLRDMAKFFRYGTKLKTLLELDPGDPQTVFALDINGKCSWRWRTRGDFIMHLIG